MSLIDTCEYHIVDIHMYFKRRICNTMLKKMEEENQGFVSEWEVVRRKGFFYYLSTKIMALGVMMLLIYIINLFLSKDVNYIMVAIIYLGITIITPILSWNINEFRYRRSKK